MPPDCSLGEAVSLELANSAVLAKLRALRGHLVDEETGTRE